MSDEKRREELKAKINEELDELSLEDLEKVAGGAWSPSDKEQKVLDWISQFLDE